MARRVVITAYGVVSALGCTPKEIFQNLTAGKTAFRKSTWNPSLVVCPVDSFDVKAYTGRFKEARYLTRGAQFCAAAAMSAMADAHITEDMREETGLFVGSGPHFDLGADIPEIRHGVIDDQGIAALWMLKFLPNTPASAIAKLTDVHGENITIGNACAASLQAIGEGYRKIKDGYLDMALVGGGDSRLSPGGLLAYEKARALHVASGNAFTYAPFDKSRKGFVPGEGGAFFLLESMESALARKAPIHAEICGFGSAIDGHNMTAPRPDGAYGEKAVLSAITEAGLSPWEIDVISSHGTGTILNDEMEANLIHRIFGHHQPLVIALKSWIGHLAAACGAVELAVCLACLAHGFLPGIRNLENACRDDIHLVRESLSIFPNTILLENFGFGGQNSALVIKPWNR